MGKSGFTSTPGGVTGQSANDVMEGMKQGVSENGTPDYSRVSSYSGADKGVHTGSSTPTTGRHGTPFGGK